MLSYRVLLDVPAELVLYVAELLGKHRREIGTRRGTRALSCWRQAIFALAWFRDRPDVARLGRDAFHRNRIVPVVSVYPIIMATIAHPARARLAPASVSTRALLCIKPPVRPDPAAPGGARPAALVNRAEMTAAYLARVIPDGHVAMDDPRMPDVRALLARHRQFALAQTPPEHSFALDVEGLLDPAITLFSFRTHGFLLGIGAIKRLGPHHAEIKSMHTAEAARGRGIARAMLTHLLAVACTQGFRRVSLETGTTTAFAPARALYQSAGFVPCGPFAGYQPSENNLFMTLEIGAVPGR